MRREPTILSWDEAPRRLAEAAEALGRPITTIGVTGPVGAGKTTLARAVAPTVVATDDYLPDYQVVPYLERDRPEHADLGLLVEHLRSLREGRPAEVPVWSFFTHRRESRRWVHPAPVIAVEGIHALHPAVRACLDIAVFVDAAPHARLARLEARERAGERGWSVEHLREHFRDVAEPTFSGLAPEYRAAADFLVVNELGGNDRTS